MLHKSRVLICLLSMISIGAPLLGQVKVDGLTLGASGAVTYGYNGDFGGAEASDHSSGLGGNGTLHGDYYSPSFLSFDVSPYYDRAMSSASAGSISDSKGYSSNLVLFGGSHPIYMAFGQYWNNTSSYGAPGLTGPTSLSSGNYFGISTDIKIPGQKPIVVSYSDSSGSNSVPGITGSSASSQKSVSIGGAYKLLGNYLGLSYGRTAITSSTEGDLYGGAEANSSSSANMYSASYTIGHLPLHSALNLMWNRADYNESSAGQGSNGSDQSISASTSLRVWQLPFSVSASYNTNVYGTYQQEILSSGSTAQISTNAPSTGVFLANASTSYALPFSIFLLGNVSHTEDYLAGGSYGATEVNINANYHFFRRLKGLTIGIGMNDSASQAGNSGAGLISNVSYNGGHGPWAYHGNFNYDQNAQTLLVTYTTSSMSYSGDLSRRFSHSLGWHISGGGAHSGFEQVQGNTSKTENASTAIVWGPYSVSAGYTQSSGQSILSANGLVTTPVPTPVLSNNSLVVFNGKSENVSIGAAPIRRLRISGSYAVSTSNNSGEDMLTNTKTTLINGYATYLYRAIFFNAGVTRFDQSLTGGSSTPVASTSFYIGISRGFKFF